MSGHDIGARSAAAAAALKPFGLHLIVDPHGFVITDKPGDPSETVINYPTIEMVEQYIAVRKHVETVECSPQPPGLLAPIRQRKPQVTDLVHYVSHGSPVRADGTQAYKSVCRAAIVTEVYPGQVTGDMPYAALCVLNPTGQFFKEHVSFHPGTLASPERTASPGEPLPLITCDDLTFEGGTWHWPGD